jgi:hypothetical protein
MNLSKNGTQDPYCEFTVDKKCQIAHGFK